MAEVKVKVKPKSKEKRKPVKAGSTNKSHGLVPAKSIIKLRTKIIKKFKQYGQVYSTHNDNYNKYIHDYCIYVRSVVRCRYIE